MNDQDQDSLSDNSSKKGKKRIALSLLIILIVVAGVAGGVFYIRWYKAQDHSVYGKLTTESYNKNGIDFSFSYPRVMQSDPSLASKIPDAPVAYSYYVNQNLQAVIAVSHQNIAPTLQSLKLTPAQFITQLRTGTGTFISSLEAMAGPNSYKQDFPGCNHSLTIKSGQTTVLCVYDVSGHNYMRLIGATQSNQYSLVLISRPEVWTAHPKVWQKVEQSFSFH